MSNTYRRQNRNVPRNSYCELGNTPQQQPEGTVTLNKNADAYGDFSLKTQTRDTRHFSRGAWLLTER